MRLSLLISWVILVAPYLLHAENDQSESKEEADEMSFDQEEESAEEALEAEGDSAAEDEENVEPLDDTEEKLDSLYADDEPEGGDWGFGLVRGEDLLGLSLESFIEDAIIVSDLKLKWRNHKFSMVSLSSLYRIVPAFYYLEAGAAVNVEYLRDSSGALGERTLDLGLRVGAGVQLDFSHVSLDFKFIGFDLLSKEIASKTFGDEENDIQRKKYFREVFSIGILYFP